MNRYYFEGYNSFTLVVRTPDGWYVQKGINDQSTHATIVKDPDHTLQPVNFALPDEELEEQDDADK